MKKSLLFILCGLLMLWAAATWFAMQTLPIGMSFHDDDSGVVSCIWESKCRAERMPEQQIRNGNVLFRIPATTDHFLFSFSEASSPMRLKSINIYGLPIFRADWIVGHIAPNDKLYEDVSLGPEEPLRLNITKEHRDLDFVRFFTLLPRLFRLARLSLAFSPIAIMMFFIVCRWLVAHFRRVDCPALFALSLIVAFLLGFPNPVGLPVPGLDSSWQWMLDHLAWSQSFGRDVVFTYGPLGFLLCPQLQLSTAVISMLVHLLFSFGWMFMLWRLYNACECGRTSAWLLLLSILFPQMNCEWRWTMLAILCVAVPATLPCGTLKQWHANVFIVFGGLTFVLLGLVKFSALVAVLGSQVFCLIYIFIKDKTQGMRAVATFSVTATITAFILFFLCFESPQAFYLWIKGSFETASGYNLHGGERTWLELLAPFVVLFIVGCFCLKKGHSISFLRFMIMFLPFVFCTVKYALVRQTVCPLIYGLAILSPLACIGYPGLKRRIVSIFFVLIIMNYFVIAPSLMSGLDMGSYPFGVNPMGVVRTIFMRSEVDRLSKLSAGKVATKDVPKPWRTRIGNGSVLFVPHDMGPAMAPYTHFRIVPLPSMQMYSACHPYLDELNAALLSGDQAPDWIVSSIDGGCGGGMLNYPCFWSKVLLRYECVDESPMYLLLRKKSSVLERESLVAESKTSDVVVPVGNWFDLGVLRERQFAVEWKPTIFGRICATILRISTCFMSVRYDDGLELRFALIPDNIASHPVDIGRLPLSSSDFVNLLKGNPIRRPVAIRFDAATSSHYNDVAILKCCR